MALAERWAVDLKADPVAATLAVDGHFEVHAGRRSRLPEHLVARQTPCLLTTVGYRVNALGCKPLPCIHKPLDPKPVATVWEDIVPDLKRYGLVPGRRPT